MFSLPALTTRTKILLGIGAFGWLSTLYLWMSNSVIPYAPLWVTDLLQWVFLTLPLPLAVPVLRQARSQPRVQQYLIYTGVFFLAWPWLTFATDYFALAWLRVNIAWWGTFASFVIGLGWVVWGIEQAARYYEEERVLALESAAPIDGPTLHFVHGELVSDGPRIWNPLHPGAWYYGARRNRKLNQSLSALLAYCLWFFLMWFLLTHLQGCGRAYELPAGGGEQAALVQQVKIQKIEKKKFVINPYSSILWNPPPIEQVELQLLEVTKHTYQIGQGKGDGAGFAGGTNMGKVPFVRLNYPGGDWNQDLAGSPDLIMLQELGIRTGWKVKEQPEVLTVDQLGYRVQPTKVPPFIYMTGQRNISLSRDQIRILREYMVDRHGLLFIDNGGSRHFHGQVNRMMGQILPRVKPVPIALDDTIHRIPYPIPFLPYVAPHGGKEALGWKVDGRWVAYYHPGDIGDAWAEDHAGVKPRIYEACYQLGTNIINYACVEQSKWRQAQED